MCGVAAVPLLIGGVGALVSAAGDANAASEKAQQDRLNEQLAQQQAADSLQRGQAAAMRVRRKGSEVIGQQRARSAASGVDENVGTAAQVQAQTKMLSDMDAQTVTNNAAREAWGHTVEADQYGEQSKLDEEAGRQSVAGTLLGGVGSTLGGLGKLV